MTKSNPFKVIRASYDAAQEEEPAETGTELREGSTSAQVHENEAALVAPPHIALEPQNEDAQVHMGTSTPEDARQDAQVHKNTDAQGPQKYKRTPRGMRLRDDLVRECKIIAAEEERKDYEVIEEALLEYIARKRVRRPR